MSNEDPRAVASALSGNSDGFRKLFERHRGAVQGVVRAFWELEPEEAKSLVEESFARAFCGLAALREPARFGSWALGIARQVCLVHRAVHQGRDPGEPPAGVELLARDPGPLDLKRRLARGALEGIEDEQVRRIGLLCYGETAAQPPEIAASLGLDLMRTGVAIERARARVKARLASRLLEERVVGPAGQGTPPEHLDPAVWERVLSGERFPGEAELAVHLGTGCERCESFLAEQPWADGLDGETDLALLSSRPLRSRRADPVFGRVMRRLRLDCRLGGAATAARQPPAKALPMGLAGLLGLAAMTALLLHGAPARQSAGSGSAAGLSSGPGLLVNFGVAPGRGSAPGGEEEEEEEIVDGVAGGSYGEDQAVLISYELQSPSFVALLRVAPGGRPELLAQPGRLSAGWHELTVNDVPARVSLRGAPGNHRFVVVASHEPVSVERLRGVLIALEEADARAPALRVPRGMSVGWFDISVEPGADPAQPAQRARLP